MLDLGYGGVVDLVCFFNLFLCCFDLYLVFLYGGSCWLFLVDFMYSWYNSFDIVNIVLVEDFEGLDCVG